jgi:hypothetical protein
LVGGQKKNDETFDDKVIIVGYEIGNNLRVCGIGCIIDFSFPINIGGIGFSQTRTVMNNHS